MSPCGDMKRANPPSDADRRARTTDRDGGNLCEGTTTDRGVSALPDGLDHQAQVSTKTLLMRVPGYKGNHRGGVQHREQDALLPPLAQLAHKRASVFESRLTLQPFSHNLLRHLCHRESPRLSKSG